jgi:hypothetical protein
MPLRETIFDAATHHSAGSARVCLCANANPSSFSGNAANKAGKAAKAKLEQRRLRWLKSLRTVPCANLQFLLANGYGAVHVGRYARNSQNDRKLLFLFS